MSRAQIHEFLRVVAGDGFDREQLRQEAKSMLQNEALRDLTFNELRQANLRRLPLFRSRAGGLAHSQPDGSDWSLAEWTNAIAGEVGEACNLAKKIIRGDFGAAGDGAYEKALWDLAIELADVVTYADIACMRTGHYLGEVTAVKFNEVSERVGCDVKLPEA